MKLQYSFIFAFLLSIITSPIFAQFVASGKSDALKVKNSTLAVIKLEKDKKQLKKFDGDELKEYEESIDLLNSYVKEAVSTYFKYSKDVIFVSGEEAEKLKKDNSEKFSFLEIVNKRNYKMNDFAPDRKNSNPAAAHAATMYHMSPTAKNLNFIITSSKSKSEIVKCPMPATGINFATVIFVVQNLENQLKNGLNDITKISALKKEIATQNPKLNNKTLMLIEPLISGPLQKSIEKGDLADTYKNKYEVVDFEKFETIIKEKNPDYAYIWVIPAMAENQGNELFNYFIINAEDGQILYMTGTSVAGSRGLFHPYHLKLTTK